MNIDRWLLRVDPARRITIPIELPEEVQYLFFEEVYITQGPDGCLRIYARKPEDVKGLSPIIHKVRVRIHHKHKKNNTVTLEHLKRITIPVEFVTSSTFYGEGKQVTMVWRETYVELLPGDCRQMGEG